MLKHQTRAQDKRSFEKNQTEESLFDEATANLRDKIKSLHETDSGDFKRKALLYLNRFGQTQMEEVSEKKNRQTKIRHTQNEVKIEDKRERQKRLESLRRDILCREFSSSDEMENVESLRVFILEGLEGL